MDGGHITVIPHKRVQMTRTVPGAEVHWRSLKDSTGLMPEVGRCTQCGPGCY